jgi:exosortase
MFNSSFVNGYGSYVLLIPAFSAYLVWSHKSQMFVEAAFEPKAAFVVLLPAFAALAISVQGPLDAVLKSELRILGVILLVHAGFLYCYGRKTFARAIFPMMLLFVAIPLPPALADRLIAVLQRSSAVLCYWLFSILGTPAYRDGIVLSIPGATIEVAKECSGINSSVALLLTVLFVAYESLESTWRRTILVLFVIPLSIAKNVIRIVTLTLLAVYVDRGFLTGKLHHRGGTVFYLVSLAALYPVYRLLRRSERKRSEPQDSGESIQQLSAAASNVS